MLPFVALDLFLSHLSVVLCLLLYVRSLLLALVFQLSYLVIHGPLDLLLSPFSFLFNVASVDYTTGD